MAWTNPTTRSTNDLITAAIWNADLVDNLTYLKSQVDAIASVPANVVAHTTAGSAPTGWVEDTAVRGRLIVGLPSGGTNAGTVGSALTNLQEPTHTHSWPSGGSIVSGGPSATTAGTGAGGNVGDATHTHTVGNDNTTGTSSTMPYIQYMTIKKS